LTTPAETPPTDEPAAEPSETDPLRMAFPSAVHSLAADGIPTIRVPLEDMLEAIGKVRQELDHPRFVDLTAVDLLTREERFELVYLFYSLKQHTWLRLKTRTDAEAPSITPQIPGADWYERELFDLFGITFAGHPYLRRIMLPDEWQGYPLRRDQPIGAEPVDFTVTREIYGAG
jgi:NADH:ubiquinone oxidoreductase subunit C